MEDSLPSDSPESKLNGFIPTPKVQCPYSNCCTNRRRRRKAKTNLALYTSRRKKKERSKHGNDVPCTECYTNRCHSKSNLRIGRRKYHLSLGQSKSKFRHATVAAKESYLYNRNSYSLRSTVDKNVANTTIVEEGIPCNIVTEPNCGQTVNLTPENMDTDYQENIAAENPFPVQPSKNNSTQTIQSVVTETLSEVLLQRYHEITDPCMLVNLLHKLDEKNLTGDFVNLLYFLSDERMDLDSVPVRALLETVRFYSLSDTRAMVYSPIMRNFWFVVMKLLGGPAIRLFSGPRGSGSETFLPSDCKINFAVPCISTLQNFITDFPKVIFPSIFDSVLANLALLQNAADSQYVLSFDGKAVNPGFRGQCYGDVNLWGFEGPPTIKQQEVQLTRELDLIKSISVDITNENQSFILEQMRSLLKIITFHIQKLRTTVYSEQKLIEKYQKLEEANPDNKDKYRHAASYAKDTESECKALIKRCLAVNRDICICCSFLNCSAQNATFSYHVFLENQSNFQCLLPPELTPDLFANDDNLFYIKQKSDKWWKLRNECRLTGSTCCDAIGLSTLGSQKEHFEHFITKKPTLQPLTAQDNVREERIEFNALATIVGLILPALFPPCHVLYEVGPAYLNSAEVRHIVQVSANGWIKCKYNGINCPQNCNETKGFSLDIKNQMNPNKSLDYRYHLPTIYVPQVQCNNFCLDTKLCMFSVFSQDSLTVQMYPMDSNLWDIMSNIIVDIYDVANVKKPVKLHPSVSKLRTLHQEYGKDSGVILGEVPTCTGSFHGNKSDLCNAPYYNTAQYREEILDANQITEQIKVMSVEAADVIKLANAYHRQKATEMVIFMMSDTDRMKGDDADSYTHPVGYAMKGKSLPVSKMRSMINLLRTESQNKGVDIVCECFDGQWSNLAFYAEDGFPLTLLHLQKKSWNSVCNLSRRGVMSKLVDIAAINCDDLEFLAHTPFNVNSCSVLGNITVFMKVEGHQRKISCCSNGGGIQYCGLLRHVTYRNISIAADEVPEDNGQTKECNNSNSGNLLTCLPEALIREILDDVEINSVHSLDLPTALSSQKCNLLQDISVALTKVSPKWAATYHMDLVGEYFTRKHRLRKEMRHLELNAICNVFKSYTDRFVFGKSDSKVKKINTILQLFGSTERFPEVPTIKQKVPCLANLCTNIVGDVPLSVLHSVLAGAHHVKNKALWKRRTTVPMDFHIPLLGESVPLFSFPEYSLERKQIEPRTMDYTHMLTNLRSVVTRKGIQGITKDSFVRVCEEHPNIISRGIVLDLIDKQCAEYAEKLFSLPVQRILEQNGDYKEAHFVQTVRNWHNACDKRGMSADERVNSLWCMYAYLLKDVFFDTFPCPTTHIKGIPIVTYAAILQMICTRFILYRQCKSRTYNARSISSLVCEGFFSTVNSKHNQVFQAACIKAADVPKVLSDIIIVENYKNSGDLHFHLQTAKRPTYPSERGNNTKMTRPKLSAGNVYKDHDFDFAERQTNKANINRRKKRKPDVTHNHSNVPLRGVRTMRTKFFKVDESALPASSISRLPRKKNASNEYIYRD